MKSSIKYLFMALLFVILQSCIGDDVISDRVPAQVRITNPISELKAGDTYQIEAMFTNIIGVQEDVTITYLSSNESVATVSNQGLLTGISAGDVEILLSAPSEDGTVTTSLLLVVGENTVVVNNARIGTARTTSSYVLEGTFSLMTSGNGLRLEFNSDWKTTSALPGLYVYLTNNPNSNANALEISEVTIFEGAHGYDIPEGTGLHDYSHVLFYCKPFGVDVGVGPFDN